MDLLGVQSRPFLARHNYYHEMLHILLWGAVAGVVEGNFAAVVAAKTFGGSDLLINVASTTPVASYLTSLFWGMLSVGRRKMRIFTLCTSGVALFTASLGMVPETRWGGWLFVLQMAAAQFFMTGVVTVRSALWKSNYPQHCRGQITASLQMVRSVTRMVAVGAAAAIFDADPSAFRYVFPAIGAIGGVAVYFGSRMRVRRERSELGRTPAATDEGGGRQTLIEPFSLAAVLSPTRVLHGAARILHEDRRFRKYMVAQMIAGCANLMVRSVVVTLVTKHLLVNMKMEYVISAALLELLPLLLMLATMSRFAAFFDRVGLLGFRVVHGICWVATMVFGMAGTLALAYSDAIGPYYVVVAVASFSLFAVMQGASLGGGAIAWNLGHLHFAHPQDAEAYMGVHVSLTGVRGLVMPSVGMLLWRTVGWGVWVASAGLSVLALLAFRALIVEEESLRRAMVDNASPSPGS